MMKFLFSVFINTTFMFHVSDKLLMFHFHMFHEGCSHLILYSSNSIHILHRPTQLFISHTVYHVSDKLMFHYIYVPRWTFLSYFIQSKQQTFSSSTHIQYLQYKLPGQSSTHQPVVYLISTDSTQADSTRSVRRKTVIQVLPYSL